MADAMLRITENGLPHQPAGWFAMTQFSLHKAVILGAKSKIFSVIASQCSHWRGNPFPGIRKDANACRAFRLHR